MRTNVLAPSARTMTSATAIPTATPTVSSMARTCARRATAHGDDGGGGRENGCGCSSPASAHAPPAATVVCRIPQNSAAHAPHAAVDRAAHLGHVG